MKKKLTKICLILTILLVNIGIVFAVTTDKNAPTVTKLTFDNTTSLKPGDKVYLNTDMKDDVSGIETVYIWVNRITLNNGTYFNNVEEMYQSLEVKFDEEKPYVIIPQVYISGTYYIREIDMFDKEDNRSYFYTKDQMQYYQEQYDYISSGYAGVSLNEGTTFDSWLDNMTMNYEPEKTDISVKFTVDAGAQDTESPFLAATNIDKEKIKYDESVTIDFKVSEDRHDMRISIGYSSGVTTSTYFNDSTGSIYKDVYKPSQFKTYGTIYVDYVILEDTSGNMAFYLRENAKVDLALDYYQNNCQVCESLHDIKFEVEQPTDTDEEEPVLVDVKINKNEFPIPSFAKIELTATDNKTLANEAYVTFKNNEKELNATLYLEEDGIYRGELNISQYAELGEYKLTDVAISDASNNGVLYSNYEHKYRDKELTIDLGFKLTSKFEPDVTTSTIASDILEKINDAADNAKIAIDATGNTIVKKEIFDAIKGTNKTIYIESHGIEWIFNGKDINETKDIDVSINVYYDYNYQNLEQSEYSGKALCLEFAENGDLPSTATVRIKLDYTLREYIGENVYVYYYDHGAEDNKIFSDVTGENLTLSENGWFEFKINHNSTYMIATTKQDDKIVKKDKVLIAEETLVEEATIVKKGNDKLIIIVVVAIVLIVLGIVTFIFIKNKNKTKIL